MSGKLTRGEVEEDLIRHLQANLARVELLAWALACVRGIT
jgi:hypothetical protein